MADKPTTPPPNSTASPTSNPGAKSESDKKSENKNLTKKKAVGPIRWSALVPVAVTCVGCFLYFSLLFDIHLKYLIETIGYHVFGAEVNVQKLKTSFGKAHFHLEGLQTTDPDHPARNLFEIGQINFGMSWDALLRGKILVEEDKVDGIQVGSPRKKAGKVKPPPPPPPPP